MTDDQPPTRLRVRAVADAQFSVLLAAFVLLAAVGAGLTYTTHVAPGTTTEERVETTWSVTTAYDHGATVTESNEVFPVGTELTDRTTYFTRIAPVLDGAARTTVDAPAAEDLEVTHDVTLVYRETDGDTTLWDRQEPLASSTTEAEPGEPVTTGFSVNVSATEEELAAVGEDLGTTPGDREVLVRTALTLTGTVDGEPVEYERTTEFGIEPAGDVYVVDDPGTDADSLDRTTTVEREETYGPLRSVGAPLALVLGLVGVGGLLGARRRGDLALTDAEREYLGYADDRSEFDEWITRVRLPERALDRPEAHADSLADLVDFAIDNDTGVVEDPITGRYHALADEYLYTFDPPRLPEAEPLAEGDGVVVEEDGNGVDGDAPPHASSDGDAAGDPVDDAEPKEPPSDG